MTNSPQREMTFRQRFRFFIARLDLSLKSALTITTVILLASMFRDGAFGADLRCTPSSADLTDLSPLVLTNSQLATLQDSYAAPEVRGLRAALDSYIAGDATEYATKLLKNTSPSILKKHFVLLEDDQGQFGGSFLTIQFKKHPEAVYQAWVYPLAAGPYDLRAWSKATCTNAQQRWMKSRYRLLQDLSGA